MCREGPGCQGCVSACRAAGPAWGESAAAGCCGTRLCGWVSVQGREAGRGARWFLRPQAAPDFLSRLLPAPPPPTALLYKPIDRVTRSTLVLHVSLSPCTAGTGQGPWQTEPRGRCWSHCEQPIWEAGWRVPGPLLAAWPVETTSTGPWPAYNGATQLGIWPDAPWEAGTSCRPPLG